MVDFAISSLRTFLYLPGSPVCDDPGKYKIILLQTVL